MDAPKAPAGWYPDTTEPSQLRYWDGDAWTQHTAPADVPPPGGQGQGEPAGGTVACPYCSVSIADTAIRCPHCGGEQRYCPTCNDLVGVWSKQKFVGLARGGTKTQYRCLRCNRVLDGPRW